MFGATGTDPMHDPMMKFRVSTWYEDWNASTGAISAAWAKEKNAGNKLLKKKKYPLALVHYTKAYQYAVGVLYNGSVEQFLLYLKGSDRSAGMQAVGTNIFLLKIIFGFVRVPGVFRMQKYSSILPDTPSLDNRELITPNKSAAIALANRSAAHLGLKNYSLALKDATRATQLCPDYVKAHFRKKQAYEGLGHNAEQRKVENDLQLYKKLEKLEHEHCITLNKVGWIDAIHLRLVYNKCHFQEALRIASMADFCVINPISVVPYNGGQALKMGLRCCLRNWTVTNMQSIYFEPVSMHGADLLERPPRWCLYGKCNEEAKSAVIEKLPGIIKCMRAALQDKKTGKPFVIHSALIGQGLIGNIDELRKVLPDLELDISLTRHSGGRLSGRPTGCPQQ